MRKFFKSYNKRINLLSITLILYSIIIIIAFFRIQILDRDQLKKIAHNKGWKNKTIYGERGKILDSDGRHLAITIKKYNFWVNTNKNFEREKIIALFSENFNRPKEFYENKLNNKSNYIQIEKNVLYLDSKKIIDNISNLSGLRYEESNKRFYPNNNLACQTLGYVDLEDKGIGGIEGKFNTLLSGDTSVVKLKRGIKGKYYQNLSNNHPITSNGSDITLTINLSYQQILQDELNKITQKTNAESSNGIIMDPRNGDILAMSSYPDFNPNNYFEYSIESFKNRVITDAYEPGSTFKIVALSTALESEKINLDKMIYCENGEMYLSNNKLLRDHEPHENLSVLDIFAHSSNIGTAKIMNEFNNIELYKFCRYFGFGSKTGLPLKGEAEGYLRSSKKWSRTSKNYISIGQELSITNIQLALAYSAIANGGYLLKPNIIKSISNNSSNVFTRKITPIRKIISEKTSNSISKALKKVVEYGTAKKMGLDGYHIAGKTGTAQKFIDNSYSDNKFISSFVAVYPIDNPRYVIIITIDSPDYGYHWANESAVPATKEIIKRIIVHDQNIIPNNTILLSNSNQKTKIKNNSKYSANIYSGPSELTIIRVPNFQGKTFKEALSISRKLGIVIEPNKLSGKIIWQSLKPGVSIKNNQKCKVHLSI